MSSNNWLGKKATDRFESLITRTLRRSAIRWRCLREIPVNSLAALYPIRSFLMSLERQDLSILTQNGFSVVAARRRKSQSTRLLFVANYDHIGSGVTRLVPESPCRLLHPCLGRLAPSLFVETGFFDFLTYQDVSGGYSQAIKENVPSNDAQFYWAPVSAVRVLFRDLHYVTLSVWWKLTLTVEIDGAHYCLNARPAKQTQK